MSRKSPKMSQNRPALKTEGLRVAYGDKVALEGLDMIILPGDLIGVIGPNGAGKTSFIKALCGRVNASGTVYIDGKPVCRGADRRKALGLVPQDIALYPHLTAKENLQVIANLLGVKGKDRAGIVSDALEAVGLQDQENKRVSAMSGGMKRRINVAAAIMHDPAVIIFDEPTAGVDIPARDVVHRLARELSDRGMAVLLITHELEQAEALCDKILILNHGTKVVFSKPVRILEHAFSGQREVVIRYGTPPSSETISAMEPFNFKQAELPTIWSTLTQASEVSFVSAFMMALRHRDELIREITVRRPGLTTLMHRIEKTGKLLP